MRALRRLTRFLPVVVGALVGMTLMVLIAQVILTRVDNFRVRSYLGDIMGYMTDSTLSRRSTLMETPPHIAAPCSEQDILDMRRVAMRSPYFHDIGRVRDGRLLCSAMVGKLQPTVPFPPPDHRSASGVLLWHAMTGIVTPGVQVDVIGRDDVVVFSSPVLPRRFATPEAGFASTASTHDGEFLFWIAGAGAEREQIRVRDTSAWYDIGTVRRAYTCTEEVDVCASAVYVGSNVFDNAALMAIALVVGGMLGGVAGDAWRLRRRYRLSVDWVTQQAAEAGRIHVMYQPLVRLSDGKMTGVEALARLNDSDGKPIAADMFIPIAERRGVIGLITRQVARRALGELHPRLLADPSFHVSINLATSDFLDEDFHKYLNHLCASLRVPHAQVALEITERSAESVQRLATAIDRLRADGYPIHIDDFGTGFSNLAYLSALHFDAIKIDRMFTQSIGSDTVGNAIIDQICHMASLLAVELIVEGVETEAQARYVRERHPEAIGQGWLFGKPVTAAGLPA